MLPGFGGHLLSGELVERRLLVSPPDAATPAAVSSILGASLSQLGPGSGTRAIYETAAAPLVVALGFGAPAAVEYRPECVAASLDAAGRPVVLVSAPWGDRLDRWWRVAVTQSQRRAARWALLFNATHLRVVDATRTYTRRYTEFDLALACADPRCAAALATIASAGMFRPQGAADALQTLVRDSELHAASVCRSLRGGVLDASGQIVTALATRRRGLKPAELPEAFEQSLTIVYRLLFLLFAEARALVPMWHAVYRDSYSVAALRDLAASGAAAGLWDAIRAMTRLAHAGCRAGELRVTPFNGRLFSPAQTPLASRPHLDNEAARQAVLALATRPAADRSGRERIAYRDLGVEQLGAVYETLLDYEPTVVEGADRPGRRDAVIRLRPGAGVRKATGTFYTPQPFAEHLVRRTLAPLVREATPDRVLALRIVDPAMGSGAFLVAACRFLATAYESALIETGGYRSTDFTEQDRAGIRRAIAERCLYGVDINPMAVQLARLSLWLATLAADRPLTFLDHRLQCGDSLVGAWIAQLRRAPVRRRRAAAATRPLFDAADVEPALRAALPVRFSLERTPGDTIEAVRAKERAFASLARRDSALAAWRRVADLWCAAWFAEPGRLPPQAFGDLTDRLLTGRSALPAAAADTCLDAAAAIAGARRFFHWELEFPEAFFEADGSRRADGGFDAVIGNPPWDMLRADAGAADRRARDRAAVAAAVRYFRESGCYEAADATHANRYQLFVERATALTRSGGRIGLVLPAGLGADHGSASLRRLLFSRCDVDSLVGFENRRGLFPIHRSVRFLLLTASAGSPTREIACRLGCQDPSALDGGEPTSPAAVRLTPALLERISGPGLAIPDLRGPRDLALVERLASQFPPLGDASGWRARFARELNATDDRALFGAPGAGLPVIEGKQLHAFAVDLGASRQSISRRDAEARLGTRFGRPRLAYRDVASATNRTTLIAAMLPAGCVSTHTVFCLRTPLPAAAQWFLCGLFNSFVANYLVRLRVSTHVTTAIVERLPVPCASDAPAGIREIGGLARYLSRQGDHDAFARLQARVASLYRLDQADFEHVLSTFPLVASEEKEAALNAFGEDAALAPRSRRSSPSMKRRR